MKKCSMPGIVLLFLLTLTGPPVAHAELYKYIDKDGIICVVDDLHQVPERYRATAVIIEGSTEVYRATAGPTVIQKDESRAEETAGSQAPRRRPLSFRVMISAAVSAAVFLLMIVLGKQPELKKNQRLNVIARNSLIATLSLYLLLAHAKDAMTIFRIVGNGVEEARQHSAEKGKKAAQAIKSLDALFEEAPLEKSADTENGGTDQSNH